MSRTIITGRIVQDWPELQNIPVPLYEGGRQMYYIGVLHKDSVSVMRFKTEDAMQRRLTELVTLKRPVCACEITEKHPLQMFAKESFKGEDCISVCVDEDEWEEEEEEEEEEDDGFNPAYCGK